MKTTKEILTEAKELISDWTRWTTGEFARDTSGKGVFPTDSGAVCWCALGAVRHVAGGPHDASEDILLHVVREGQYACTVEDLNDNQEHEVVLEMFDLAIGMAE